MVEEQQKKKVPEMEWDDPFKEIRFCLTGLEHVMREGELHYYINNNTLMYVLKICDAYRSDL